MKLKNILTEKKASVLETWLNFVFEGYPSETSLFLKTKKDRFDNPVAYEFHQGIEGIYEALIHGMDNDLLLSQIDKIISIRAIQDLSPSKAVAFIFLLKTAIRKELHQEIVAKDVFEGLLELESRIDGLALLCFDIYMKRREKLYEIRTNEAKTRVSGLLRMAGLVSDLEKEPADID